MVKRGMMRTIKLGCLLCCLYSVSVQAVTSPQDLLVQNFIAKGGISPEFSQLPQCSGSYHTWHNCVLYTLFHNTRRIRSYVVFKNGKPNGVYKSFFFNGASLTEKFFVDGVENGMRTSYSSDGRVIERTPYVNGLRHGVSFTYYSTNGSVKSKQTYVNGLREGENLEYYDNGQLRQSASFHNDVLQGKFVMYHDNGQKYIEDNFEHGLQSGVFRKYDTTGQLVWSQNNKNGRHHGVTIYYLSNGAALFSVVFDNGKIIYGKCGADGSGGRDLTPAELKNFEEDRGYPRCEESLKDLKYRHHPAETLQNTVSYNQRQAYTAHRQ